MDLSDIVSQSISSAREDGTLPLPEDTETAEPTETLEAVETTETVETPKTTETTETPEETVETVETTEETLAPKSSKKLEDDEDAELTKLLEEFGYKALSPNARNNRIPYKESRRIIGTAIKRARERIAKDLSDRDAKLATFEQEVGDYRKVDQLIKANPEQYMRMLGAMHPDLYGRYLTPAEAKREAKEVANVPDAKDDAMPKPDIKYDDGSVAYSPEQHEKLLAWNRREAVREIKGELNKELEPIRKQREAGEWISRKTKEINAEISELRDIWGQPFLDQEEQEKKAKGSSDIGKYMHEHPGTSLRKATGIVLTKKLQADRTTMRTELMAELNAKGKKKVTTPPSARKVISTPDESASEEDRIQNAVREAFRKATGG